MKKTHSQIHPYGDATEYNGLSPRMNLAHFVLCKNIKCHFQNSLFSLPSTCRVRSGNIYTSQDHMSSHVLFPVVPLPGQLKKYSKK